MPRQARIDLPGYLYHIIVRGVNRCSIFRSDSDRLDFLRRLSAGLAETGSLCLTWALMTNHFHLMIMAGATGVAGLMHPLLTGYVGAFNRRYQRVGHLVQNRFKAILCQSDQYLWQLARYIPLNPVRAALIQTPSELARYPWTGHGAVMGLVSHPWQATGELLSHFGSTIGVARQTYENYLIDGWNEGRRPDLEGMSRKNKSRPAAKADRVQGASESLPFDARVLGDHSFAETILQKVAKIDECRSAARAGGLTLERLQTLAAQTTGADAAALAKRDRQRPVSEARALFVYGALTLLPIRACELARLLGQSSGSMSELRRRGAKIADKYQFLKTVTP